MNPRLNRIRFRDALVAMRSLRQDPNGTDAVFEVVEALAGNHPQRLLERIRRDVEGRRLLRERPLFDPRSADMGALERLPQGTFGHEFATWMRENEFEPGLTDRERGADRDLAYVGTRLTQVHDFWHVLSGYNRDPLGELGILAFSVGQTATPGFVFILANVAGQSVRNRWRDERLPWSPLVGYLWRAYGAGRRARFLPPLVLEDYFEVPLEIVRRDLAVEPLRKPLNSAALPPISPPVAQPTTRHIEREYMPC